MNEKIYLPSQLINNKINKDFGFSKKPDKTHILIIFHITGVLGFWGDLKSVV